MSKKKKRKTPLVLFPEELFKEPYWTRTFNVLSGFTKLTCMDVGFELDFPKYGEGASKIASKGAEIIFIEWERDNQGLFGQGLRKNNQRVKLALYDFATGDDLKDIESFLQACKRYDGEVKKYLENIGALYVIQGRPSAETLKEIIDNTLRGELLRLNRNYENTRLVFPR